MDFNVVDFSVLSNHHFVADDEFKTDCCLMVDAHFHLS